MNRKELWEVFMKTGCISDYLKYTKASQSDYESEMPWEEQAEISEELSADPPYSRD